jgi:hypothetical protein
MVWSAQFRRVPVEGGGGDVYVVGHPLVDDPSERRPRSFRIGGPGSGQAQPLAGW